MNELEKLEEVLRLFDFEDKWFEIMKNRNPLTRSNPWLSDYPYDTKLPYDPHIWKKDYPCKWVTDTADDGIIRFKEPRGEKRVFNVEGTQTKRFKGIAQFANPCGEVIDYTRSEDKCSLTDDKIDALVYMKGYIKESSRCIGR